MKIRLKKDVPVDRKHGLTAGRVLETVDAPKEKKSLSGVWVQGDGEKVRVLYPEYEHVAGEGE